MLVVILVIGVIAAIAVPMISSILGETNEAAALRNAQMLATISGHAQQAGNQTLADAGTKEAAVELLSAGVFGSGSLADVGFRMPLSAEDQAQALPFLKFENGLLRVDSP